jgi:hypothetical protein
MTSNVTVTDEEGETLKPPTTSWLFVTDPSEDEPFTSCQFDGGASLKLARVRCVGAIENDKVACRPGATGSPLMFAETAAGAANAVPVSGTSPRTAAARKSDRALNLRIFKVIHLLVVAVRFREARRTPDQNTHHPPFGLWRQPEGARSKGPGDD